MAGRNTLIKYVLNTYPLYSMQTSILPVSVISSLDLHCKKFLWNKVDQSRYLSRTSWDIVTNPIVVGGLGIRKLKIWNLCFMAKLAWKKLVYPSKLWVQILSTRYLKHSSLLSIVASSYASPLWKDIIKGLPILNQGACGMIIGLEIVIFIFFRVFLFLNPLNIGGLLISS